MTTTTLCLRVARLCCFLLRFGVRLGLMYPRLASNQLGMTLNSDLLPLPLKCWVHRCAPPCLTPGYFFLKPEIAIGTT